MNIREYNKDDYKDVISIFKSNQAQFFIPSDLDDFSSFLKDGPGYFYIGSIGADIIACGGFWFPSETQASLTWGMVHNTHHKCGLGSKMLDYRIEQIKAHGAKEVICSTSQLTETFFIKHGFVKQSQAANGYGPGIDEVILTLSI